MPGHPGNIGQAPIAARCRVSHDTLIHRMIRPAIRRIAPTGVTPNQLTTLRLISGLVAAAAFAQGGVMWPDMGGGIFVLAILLDRADGELARQTGQCSLGGHRYDLVCDCTASVAAFLGLGLGLMGTLGAVGILLGLSAGTGVGALFWQLNVLKLAPLRAYTLLNERVVVDPDDAMIFVPILIWCEAAQPMLIAAAVITPAAAIWLGLPSWHSGRPARLRQTRRAQ